MSSSLITIATELAPEAQLRGEQLLQDLRQKKKTLAAVKAFCEGKQMDSKNGNDIARQVMWELTFRYVDTQWTKESRDRAL